MQSPAQLVNAYRETSYETRMPGGARTTLRIGTAVPEELRRWTGRTWPLIFLTACNPRSKLLPLNENRNRMRTMIARMDQYRVRKLIGVGHVPDQPWREPSFLVVGLTLENVDRIAIEFGQNAVVIAANPGSTRLRIYRNEWRGRIGSEDDIMWAGT